MKIQLTGLCVFLSLAPIAAQAKPNDASPVDFAAANGTYRIETKSGFFKTFEDAVLTAGTDAAGNPTLIVGFQQAVTFPEGPGLETESEFVLVRKPDGALYSLPYAGCDEKEYPPQKLTPDRQGVYSIKNPNQMGNRYKIKFNKDGTVVVIRHFHYCLLGLEGCLIPSPFPSNERYVLHKTSSEVRKDSAGSIKPYEPTASGETPRPAPSASDEDLTTGTVSKKTGTEGVSATTAAASAGSVGSRNTQ